jgi:hypothetical protein
MAKYLTWVSDHRLQGWSCSQCGWTCPLPSLLKDDEAKAAFDRLAARKFQDHNCGDHGSRASAMDGDSFADRARKLVVRGFKPKDAAEITLQEIVFESRNDPSIAARAAADAEDFIKRVKEGRI